MYKLYLKLRNIKNWDTNTFSHWILGLSLMFLLVNTIIVGGFFESPLTSRDVAEEPIIVVTPAVWDVESLIEEIIKTGVSQKDYLTYRMNLNEASAEQDIVRLATIINETQRESALREMRFLDSSAYGWLYREDKSAPMFYGYYTASKVASIVHRGKTYDEAGTTTYKYVLDTTAYSEDGKVQYDRVFASITYKDGKIQKWSIG